MMADIRATIETRNGSTGNDYPVITLSVDTAQLAGEFDSASAIEIVKTALEDFASFELNVACENIAESI